jgi:hypothetical protein
MRAADQWARIEEQLEPDWAEVRLSFTPEGSVDEAAAILGPLQPGRGDGELQLHITRAGGGVERVRPVFRTLDRRRVWGTLELVDVSERSAPSPGAEPPATPAPALTQQWHGTLTELPPDWSDLLCELELDSSDHLPRAALLGAPMNPTRVPDATAFRFRVSGKQGYGVSPQMARRCFERMDAEGITGRIVIVYELSDTENDVTQGPVWRVAGRSV